MIVKAIIDEDFTNYKKPSMLIAFPSCTWKCEKECGQRVCHNGALATAPDIVVSAKVLCQRYLSNSLTKAIVCAGLEPMDSIEDLYTLIYTLRHDFECDNDVVIYTGYTKEECEDNGWLEPLRTVPNIIMKFGRFIPDEENHFDEVLGVNLASKNQYGEKLVNENIVNRSRF